MFQAIAPDEMVSDLEPFPTFHFHGFVFELFVNSEEVLYFAAAVF